MENSFFYFFSAVPQVLGGVLALFGVFVLFKLQSMTIEMINEASEFYQLLFRQYLRFEDDSIVALASQFLPELNRGIQNKNIIKIKESIDTYAHKIIIYHKEYVIYVQRFYILYDFYQKLVKNTLLLSILTASNIILCLAIIPFEKRIINYPVHLYIIYSIVILSIIFIFYKLISTLKESIQQQNVV